MKFKKSPGETLNPRLHKRIEQRNVELQNIPDANTTIQLELLAGSVLGVRCADCAVKMDLEVPVGHYIARLLARRRGHCPEGTHMQASSAETTCKR